MNDQDHDPKPTGQPATVAPEGEARPVRRRSPRAAKVEDGAAAETPKPAEAPADMADGAQAKPRRTRRKAADGLPEASPPEPVASGPAVAPAQAEAPPTAPRRRSRKVAEEADAGAAPAVAVAAVGAGVPGSAAEALAPRRRRASAAEAAAPLAQGDGPSAPAGSPSAATSGAAAGPEAPAPRRRARAAAAQTADSAAPETARESRAQAPAEAPAAPATEQLAGSADAGAGASDGGNGEGAAEDGDGDSRRRRNRNRRRGRRGGDRAERSERDTDGEVEYTVVTVAPGADDEVDSEAEPALPAGGDADLQPEGASTAPLNPSPAAALSPVDAATAFAHVVSGTYDAEAGDVPPEPEKRVLLPDPDAPKLHKVLAQAGIGSRRDMEQLIADGKVEVNGEVAHVGQRVSFGDRISVGGRHIKVRIAPLPARVIAYHKPAGEVVTHDDPQRRPTVFRRLPRLPQGKWQSVGRLDINTEGLLLFTNSGELANQLMHPRFGVEREYAVRVLGTLDDTSSERLLQGVEIDGQRAAFKSIEDGGGEGVNHWYRVVITEGRNREVRKLFDKVGLGVSRLIRIRYGGVVLPRGLKRGIYVDLNAAEVEELRRLSARPGSQPREGGQARDAREGRNARGQGARAERGDRPERAERPDRPERGDRPNRGERPQRPRKNGGGQQHPQGQAPQPLSPSAEGPRRDKRRDKARDPDAEYAAIPNPLMQTFDKRAIREARQPRREYSEDGPIPNPLEQTYDKRFVQKGKNPFGGKKGGGGGGAGGQPDPMQTTVGYIGGDAFVRKFQGNGGAGGGGFGGGGGGGGNRGGRGNRKRGGR